MRILQTILLLIGISVVGAVVGTVGTYLALKAVLPEPRGESWGGAPVWIFLIACGMLLGMIIAFFSGLSWAIEQGRRRWSAVAWFGAFIGLVLGFSASGPMLDGYNDLPRQVLTIVISLFSAIVGGVLAGTVIPRIRRSDDGE